MLRNQKRPGSGQLKSTGASRMSALGQKRTFAVQKGMSALPPIADMCDATRDVRFGPTADIRPVHSITSSAMENTPAGMVRPSALAVVRLITNSNLVD